MAKSSLTIHMDYKRSLEQADRLANAAKKVRKEQARLEQCRGRISGAWKGESGTMFMKKVSKAGTDLSEIARVLENASSTVRSIAKETYRAEMAALQLAQQRKS